LATGPKLDPTGSRAACFFAVDRQPVRHCSDARSRPKMTLGLIHLNSDILALRITTGIGRSGSSGRFVPGGS
jgi:hypothetical protein